MINSVVLLGHLANDPEMAAVGDTLNASFRLAVERSFTAENGQKHVDWVPIKVWGKVAESCEKYLQKGDMVGVQGALHTSSYTDKDGIQRTGFEINARTVQFLKTKWTSDNAETDE